ncbi:MAG: hypothetical protein B7Z29_18385 [Hyphomicrobium sp. 12-62-95]|nr:MAG: hypothetical protein B7Z29_18385 [Hyphomicrobium sp. 12-62-95]
MKQSRLRRSHQRHHPGKVRQFCCVTNPEADLGPVNDNRLFRHKRKCYLQASRCQAIKSIRAVARVIDKLAFFEGLPACDLPCPLLEIVGLLCEPTNFIKR